MHGFYGIFEQYFGKERNYTGSGTGQSFAIGQGKM